ncbi:hypothetical protein [Thermococcus sp.]|uniref:hypothetical protein n=1 Tax=Thermococcus sp. TaxID=35749 RepID=UPI0025CBD814|nr:hypothetical protein [Thermococcus sp.]
MRHSRSLKIGAVLLIFFVICMNSEIALAAKSPMDESAKGTEKYLDQVFKEYYELKVRGNESQARQLLEGYGFKHLAHEELLVKTVPGTPVQPMGGDQDDLHLSIDWNVYNDNGVAKLFVTYQWTWDHIEEFEDSPDKVSIAIPVGYWDGPTNSYPYHWLLEVSDRPYFISTLGVKSYEVHCESGYDDLAEDSNKLLHICRIYAEVYDHYNVGFITIGFSRINPEYYDHWIKTGFVYVHTWNFGPVVEYPLELGGLLISSPTGTIAYGAISYAVNQYIIDKYLKGGWSKEYTTEILLMDGTGDLPPGALSIRNWRG